MQRHPSTRWYTPDGTRALRARLSFQTTDAITDKPVTKEIEVCPIAFRMSEFAFMPCDPDRCLLMAHSLHYSKEETYTLLHAIDGVPGCDQTLRKEICRSLLVEEA